MAETVGFQGISFPFRITGRDHTGGIVTSSTSSTEFDHIKEAIHQIVGTIEAERWLNHQFGAAPVRSPGEPMSQALAAAIQSFVRRKLILLEDRCDFPVVRVIFDPDEGRLFVTIGFVVRQSLYQDEVTVELTNAAA